MEPNTSTPSAIQTRGIQSRRRALYGVAVACASLLTVPRTLGQQRSMAKEAQSTGVEGLLTYLHQEIDIKASPQRIYDAILDSKQFASFTGLPAEISSEAGGVFSIFGGLIVGRNLELVPQQRIVQAWRPSSWEPGIYSLVKFVLKAQGAKTTIVLDHTGFPEGDFRHLNSGWYERYWEPLRKFLA